MIGRGLTVLLCCAVLCWTQDIEWNWRCDNVTEQAGVNMSQVLGRWYVAVAAVPGVSTADVCMDAELSNQTEDLTSFDFYIQVNASGRGSYRSNRTVVSVITPSRWHDGRDPVMVVDLPPQGDTLTLAGCREKQGADGTSHEMITVILSKSKNPDLQSVFSRIQTAGLPESNRTVFNLSSCETEFV